MKRKKVKCHVCGEEIDPKKSNGIYRQYDHPYYCKDKKCQERFIEDAGDPPMDEDEGWRQR